jgi:hypothetical protein
MSHCSYGGRAVPKCLPGSTKTVKKKCIELAKKICRLKGVCEKCGRTKKQGWRMHAHHIIPVTYAHTAALTSNLISLCASCHSMGPNSIHQSSFAAAEFTEWFNNKYPGMYLILRTIAQNKSKVDWNLVYIGLQYEWKMKSEKYTLDKTGVV